MEQEGIIVGVGELLWDMLPDGKALGGAPANFAYQVCALGKQGVPLSRVGEDRLGDEIVSNLEDIGVMAGYLQRDSEHATGTVDVQIDAAGVPDFHIVEDVAWDYLEPDDRWEGLVEMAEAICFGTLAQRSVGGRRTIQQLLGAAPRVLKVYDVNIRQSYYSREVISASLAAADIVKLNEAEVGVLMGELRPQGAGAEASFLRRLMSDFEIDMVCVTLGAQGCRIMTRDCLVERPVPAVEVVDTVGSGDAFTAALVVKYLAGAGVEAIAEAANLLGSYVASRRGATPVLDDDVRERFEAIG